MLLTWKDIYTLKWEQSHKQQNISPQLGITLLKVSRRGEIFIYKNLLVIEQYPFVSSQIDTLPH